MLCLLFVGRIKEREKKNRKKCLGTFFFPGPDMTFWLCNVGFSWLLGAIKG
jgi:hypothetical protein